MIRYPVNHPELKKYIKFFWEIHAEHMQLNHKLIPVRNIDVKFNLNDTPHYICLGEKEYLLGDVYFSGLQDHFRKTQIKLNGKVDVLGICFFPEGLYPFLKIPLCEFRNKLLNVDELGVSPVRRIRERLLDAPDVNKRLTILEEELLALLDDKYYLPDNLRKLFQRFNQESNSLQISEFCNHYNLSARKLERLYDKYIGISPKTYATLNRFQDSVNHLLHNDYQKLSDIAFGNGYFDQMHFIKDFKRFAGNTPGKFIAQNNSMLQIWNF